MNGSNVGIVVLLLCLPKLTSRLLATKSPPVLLLLMVITYPIYYLLYASVVRLILQSLLLLYNYYSIFPICINTDLFCESSVSIRAVDTSTTSSPSFVNIRVRQIYHHLCCSFTKPNIIIVVPSIVSIPVFVVADGIVDDGVYIICCIRPPSASY